MLGWLKKLLYIEKPEETNHRNLIVPIRYVNTEDTSFGGRIPGYFRICMNLETGEVTKDHISGTYINDEIIELDTKIAYDNLPNEYKPKYRKYLESTNVKIQFD